MKTENLLNNYDETALKHSYYDACSNKDFKKYLDTLDINEEVLMKYTSTLEDSFLEYNNCLNCKGLDKCPNNIKGYQYMPTENKGLLIFSYERCLKQHQADEDNAYKENLELFEMPKNIKEANFKDIYKDDKNRVPIIKYFKDFMSSYFKNENPKGLYLTGSFGSGKTYLIASLFNEMAKKKVKSTLIYFPEFLRSLKASFNSNYSEKFDYIKKSPLLLLDDIGAENCSNWSRDEVLGPILQYRMENNLPTFFTSNLTLEELEKALAITSSAFDKVKARRIIERIKQLTNTLELVSKNRRES